MEFVVVEFPGQDIDPTFAPALRAQVERGVIRIVDLLFVSRDPDGTIRTVELGELEGDAEYRAFDEIADTIDGLISPDDVAELASSISPGTAAMLVLFEHTWMRDLRDAMLASGGRVVFTERIPANVVDAVVASA